jgi:mannose/fructose/N-acetylgalactosamine-specific phosphotransferase system component IID
MAKSLVDISEDNAMKITYGALVFGLAIFFGLVTWMTTMELHSQDNQDQIKQIQSKQENVQNVLIQIDKRLLRIEILLEKIATK